ncbi:MAG: sensor histidine kinase [Gemmatimonadaceae bacterium]
MPATGASDARFGAAPAPGSVFWAGLVITAVTVGVLRAAYFFLDDVAGGGAGTLPRRLATEGTAAAASLLLLPLLVWVARQFPPRRAGWSVALTAHAANFLIFTVGHTVLISVSRQWLMPVLGFADYDYGALGVRILMEAPNDLTTYGVVLIAMALVESLRARRERELHGLALEKEVARSRLANLQLQLQPHFLFNALNTISATMYDDPRAADEMVNHLSDLLRHALGTADRREMPLGDELRLLESYLAIGRARFGARVEVSVEIEPGLDDVLVPPLLLQPLVENAFRHGIAPSGQGRVTVRARREEGAVVISVENDLQSGDASLAARADASGPGLGLSVTATRLQLLYGVAGSLEAGPSGVQTYLVRLRIPLRRADSSIPPREAPPLSHAYSHS